MKTRFYLAAVCLSLFAGLAAAQGRLGEVSGKPGTFNDSTGFVLSAQADVGYVSNPGSGLVQKFRADNGQILASIALPPGVGAIALTPDERTLIVVGVTAQKLYTIATDKMTLLHEISYRDTTFNSRSNVVVSSGGQLFYVSDPGRNRVLSFVTRTGEFDNAVAISEKNPTILTAIPETTRVAVLASGKAENDPESIWMIDSLLNRITDFPILPEGKTEAFNNIQATPGGVYLFVGSYGNDKVYVYNLGSKNVGSYPSGGSGPGKIVASADGRYLAVVNVKSKNIALFEGIPVLSYPTILELPGFEPTTETTPVFSPDGHSLYIPAAGTNEIIVYDPGRRIERKRILTAPTPTRLAISPGNRTLASLDLGGNVLSLIALDATPLYVPYLTQNAREYTGLALANLGEDAATVSLTALDNAGNVIPGTSNPRLVPIPAGQQMSLVAGQAFGFSTSANIEGYIEAYVIDRDVKLLYMTGSGQTRLDGLPADSTLGKFLGFGRITQGVNQFGSTTNTEIVLQNPSETDATLTIRFFVTEPGSKEGVMLDYFQTTLARRSRIRKSIPELIPSASQAIRNAYVDVSSSIPIKGIEVVRIGDSIALVPATLRDQPVVQFDAVQFASGGAGVLEGRPITSNLAITNTTGDPIKFTAEVLDEQGNIVPEGSTPVEREVGAFQSISGGADEMLDFPDPLVDPALYEGTLHIVAQQEGLAANLLYGDALDGKYLSSVSLTPQQGTQFAFIHFAEGSFDPSSSEAFYTGLAFYNPYRTEAGVVVEVFSPTGTMLGRNNSIELAPLARNTLTLGQIISNLPRPSTGYVRITSTRPIEVFEVFGSSRSELLVSVAPVVLAP